LQDADGVAIFDYRQAQQAAREWWRHEQRREDGHDVPHGPYTVAEALDAYLTAYERRGGKAVYTTRLAAKTHILPRLGEIAINKLTTRKIEDWHRGIAEQPARVRTKPGQKQQHRMGDGSVDMVRRRRATANRILTVLKSALNQAWDDGQVDSDTAWRRVKPFKAVDTARVRYLLEAECVRLVNACEPAFRNLVCGALTTGCRYAELSRMHVSDFNSDAGIVTIQTSKAGKPRHAVLNEEGCQFFSQLTAGRLGTEAVFMRDDGERWGTSHQRRPMLDASDRAGIKPAVSFHVLRHTHGSMLAMRGVPMGVIAEQLGHADTRMTEKYYAHLAPSYVADTIRAHFPRLGIGGDDKVVPLQQSKR